MKTTADIKYSVIIPAYNSGKTIAKCLDSLLMQMAERKDTEIIIVNDGSFDETERICRKYMNSNQFIKYFHIENSGVSAARNTGLKYACGKYIVFVDSDDYVAETFLAMLDDLVSDEWDLCILNYQTFNGLVTKKRDFRNFCSHDRKQTIRYLTDSLRKQNLNAVYGKVFKRKLIEDRNVTFPEGLQIGEDKVFMTRYAAAVRSLNVSDRIAYTVSSENSNSLSRMKRESLYRDIIREHTCLFELIEENRVQEQNINLYFARAITYSYFRSAYSSVFELNKSSRSYQDTMDEIDQILEAYNKQNFSYKMDWKSRIISLPVRHHLSLFMYVVMKGISFGKSLSK